MKHAFFSGASILGMLVAGCTLDAEIPATGAGGGGGGSTVGPGGAGGAAPTCSVPSDCPPADPCHVLTCPAGTCGTALATFGADCGDPATQACDADGNCVSKEGGTCEVDADCLDSPCADGFCCDTVCDSECASCSQVGFQGVCTPYPVLTNPEVCTLGVCDGGGSCASGGAGVRGTIGTNTGDTLPQAVAVDALGSATIFGHFSGTTDAGGTALVSTAKNDIFIARINALGQHVWSKSFPGTEEQFGLGVAAWPTGEVAFVGSMDDDVDFGGGALVNGGAFDAIVVKLAADGTHAWSKRFGDASVQSFDAAAIAPDGDVVVAGEFAGVMDFGGGVMLTSAGAEDIVVARFDSAGTLVWAKRFGDAAEQRVGGVAVDSVGNVLVAGHFLGTLDFGVTPLTTAGGFDAYVAKLGPTGDEVWAKRFGDGGDQRARGVAAAPDGSVAIVGMLGGTADFGGTVLTSAGAEDAFAAAFAEDGAHLWSKRFGDAAEQQAYGVDVDLNGNVVVTGDLIGTADFGGGAIASFGDYDAFVAKFAADGTHLWSQRYGDDNKQHGRAIRVSPKGAVWVTGEYLDLMDFGVGPQLSSGTGYDAYWVSLLP